MGVADDLWDHAYEQLKAQNGQLVGQFEKLLAKSLRVSHASQALASASFFQGSKLGSPFAKVGTLQRHTQMMSILDEKIKIDEEAVRKFRVGGNEIVTRDQLDKVVKIIAAAKDFVGALVASDPHATLAWTGVCALLPVNWFFILSSQKKTIVHKRAQFESHC